MTQGTIRLTHEPRGIATLTLARPARHNAMDAAMIAELTEATRQLAEDRRVRAVVLTGEGRSFCAGADLAWMQAQFDATPTERMAEARALARMLKSLNELPQPLIGRINGQAFGGGLGLIAVCDVAISISAARFAFTEVRLGLVPATISPYVLARMGEGRAREVFFSGRLFDAADAVRLGLLARAVAEGELDAAIEAEVAPYLAADPDAVADAKALARSFARPVSEADIERTAERLAACWDRPRTRAAIAAFLAGKAR